jgi:uncharacterized protein (TIGR00251 family)
MNIVETKDGVVLDVFVKPNSSKFKLFVENDEITIFSTEEPVKGKVNKEIIKELTRLFHNRVEIISGLTSKQKKIIIRNVGKNEVESILSRK